MLMAADRVDVVEGVVEDLARGRIPNIPAEMGLRSELSHNRSGLVRKVAVTGAVVGLGLVAAHLISRRNAAREDVHPAEEGDGKTELQRNAERGAQAEAGGGAADADSGAPHVPTREGSRDLRSATRTRCLARSRLTRPT
jgi:hypothetical protein